MTVLLGTLRPVHVRQDAKRIRASGVLSNFQTDYSDSRSWITCEPVNDTEAVYLEAVAFLKS